MNRTAWLEALFSGLPYAVIVMDRDGTPVYCNPAATALFGDQIEAVSLEAWAERHGFYQGDGHTLFPGRELPMVRALETGGAEEAELIYRPKNRSTGTWLRVTAQSLDRTEEGLEGVVVIFRDISERKQLEKDRKTTDNHVKNLHAFSRRIAESGLSEDRIVEALADYCAGVFGDACLVTLLENGEITNKTASHADPEIREVLREATRSAGGAVDPLIRRVTDSHRPILLRSVPASIRARLSETAYGDLIDHHGIGSTLVVPLEGGSGVIGAVMLARAGGQPAFTATERTEAEDVAYRATLAIENSRLYDLLRAEIQGRISATRSQMESEVRLRAIFDHTALGIKVLNREGEILETNQALNAMLGIPGTELRGRRFTDFIHPEDVARGMINLGAIRRGLQNLQFEHRILARDGSVVWVSTNFTGIPLFQGDGFPDIIVGMVDDITERKRLESDIQEMRAHFLQGIEQERLRLAQDLHDGAVQDLHSALYFLSNLGEDDGQIAERIDEVKKVIQMAITELRNVAQELRPAAIMYYGLSEGIRSHIESLKENHPELEFELTLDEEEDLPEDVRMALFRIYQTSISNVIRHAEASRVSIRLLLDAEEVSLEISDDGKGFEIPKRWVLLMRDGHFGLAGAVERAEAVGGNFDLTSSPGKGTRILVRLARPTIVPGDEASPRQDAQA